MRLILPSNKVDGQTAADRKADLLKKNGLEGLAQLLCETGGQKKLYFVITLNDLLHTIFELAQCIGRIFPVGGKVAKVNIILKLDLRNPADLGMVFDADETY